MEKLTEYNNFEIDGDLITKDDLIDLIRLQSQLVIHENALYSILECYNIWISFSASLQASWISFPELDDYILPSIMSSNYFESFEKWSEIPY